MKSRRFKFCVVTLFCIASFFQTGCALMTELVGSAIGNSLNRSQVRDGRDMDAEGLTTRDRIARFEEESMRNWDQTKRNLGY